MYSSPAPATVSGMNQKLLEIRNERCNPSGRITSQRCALGDLASRFFSVVARPDPLYSPAGARCGSNFAATAFLAGGRLRLQQFFSSDGARRGEIPDVLLSRHAYHDRPVRVDLQHDVSDSRSQ